MSSRKTKVNDLCPCTSGKKYKKCCMLCDVKARQQEVDELSIGAKEGHPFTSEKMHIMANYFNTKHALKTIEISNIIVDNICAVRFSNINKNKCVVMLAIRNELNEGVFANRCDDDSDIMFIYHNNYRLFNYEKEPDALNTLSELIKSV